MQKKGIPVQKKGITGQKNALLLHHNALILHPFALFFYHYRDQIQRSKHGPKPVKSFSHSSHLRGFDLCEFDPLNGKKIMQKGSKEGH